MNMAVKQLHFLSQNLSSHLAS